MRHLYEIIGMAAIVAAVIREMKRHPEAETLADLDS